MIYLRNERALSLTRHYRHNQIRKHKTGLEVAQLVLAKAALTVPANIGVDAHVPRGSSCTAGRWCSSTPGHDSDTDPPADQAKSASDEATRIVELAKALTAHLEHSMATLESGARP